MATSELIFDAKLDILSGKAFVITELVMQFLYQPDQRNTFENVVDERALMEHLSRCSDICAVSKSERLSIVPLSRIHWNRSNRLHKESSSSLPL
jgi:hypothetical protein